MTWPHPLLIGAIFAAAELAQLGLRWLLRRRKADPPSPLQNDDLPPPHPRAQRLLIPRPPCGRVLRVLVLAAADLQLAVHGPRRVFGDFVAVHREHRSTAGAGRNGLGMPARLPGGCHRLTLPCLQIPPYWRSGRP